MVKITATYLGEKHCQAQHEPSKAHLETDAPKDNQGRGESFSPTDLMATALGTCILTTMAILMEKEGVDLNKAKISVEKEMASNPRRIISLKTVIELSKNISTAHRQKLEDIAHNCPVKKSLHPDVQTPTEIRYVL